MQNYMRSSGGCGSGGNTSAENSGSSSKKVNITLKNLNASRKANLNVSQGATKPVNLSTQHNMVIDKLFGKRDSPKSRNGPANIAALKIIPGLLKTPGSPTSQMQHKVTPKMKGFQHLGAGSP